MQDTVEEPTPSPQVVRITVDLDPELYRLLTGWVMSTAVDLEVPRLSMATCMRAMIRVTTQDPVITARVHSRIRAEKGSAR